MSSSRNEDSVRLLEDDRSFRGELLPNVGIPGIRDKEQKFTRKLASARIDGLFVQRFFQIMSFSGTSFFSLPHLYLWRILLSSCLLGLASEMITEWVGKMGTAVARLSLHYVEEELWVGFLLAGAIGLASILISFDTNLLAWHWRKNITKDLNAKYLTDTNSFNIVYLKEYALDNPDQRIIDDVNQLCANTASIFSGVSSNLATLISVTIGMASQLGYVFVLASYGLSLITAIFYLLIMRPLARENFVLDRAEGDFRYGHARIRENSEAIAFFHGDSKEKKNVDDSLETVISQSRRVAKWSSIFTLYRSLTQNGGAMLLLVTNALLLWFDPSSTPFNQKYYLLATGSQFSIMIMNSFGSLFTVGSAISVVAGAVGRVAQLYEVCDHLNEFENRRKTEFKFGDVISFENVSCDTPQHNLLVRDLNIKIPMGCNVLIMGPSGCGKSSLLRTISGIWKANGVITKPQTIGREIFFVPQKAYFVYGNLKDQVIYPDIESKKSDEELFKCLKKANVEQLVRQYGWDSIVNWSSTLSPGEQQRIIFARLFYHEPKFAVLDEATSALDTKNEAKMYKQCHKLNITCFSVGHRLSLYEHHHKILEFDGNANYLFRDITEDDLKRAIHDKSWQKEVEKRGNLDLSSPLDIQNDEIGEQDVERALEERSYITKIRYMLKIVHNKFCTRETALLFALFICCLGSSALQALIPLIKQKFITAFLEHNSSQFYLSMFILIVQVIFVVIFGPGGYAAGLFLGIRYRHNLVSSIHERYFKDDLFHPLNTVDHVVDNVDQRVSQEVKESTTGWTTILYLILSFFLIPLMMTFLLATTTIVGKYLVLMVWGYNIVYLLGTLVGTYFVSKYTILQSVAEGHLRFSHIKVREYAESIVFNGPGCVKKEAEVIGNYFDKVLDSYWDVIRYQIYLKIWLELLSSFGQVISVVMMLYAIPTVFPRGTTANLAEISGVYSSLVSYVNTLLTTVISLLKVSALVGQHSGHLTRAVQLVDRMKKRANTDQMKAETSSCTTEILESVVEMRDVFIETPNGRRLNEHGIHFTLKQNESLIIMGPSGCGKSSILRVLCGLWTAPSGKIVHPPTTDFFFVPQKAYMVLGSLYDQVIYPHNSQSLEYSDKEVRIALKLANLEYLLTRFELNEVEIWSSVLSGGEQQRLSMARVFFHKPKFAILDESTSALDPFNEELMYNTCEKLGITLISIGHRESLMNYHQKMLCLDGKGGWDLYKEQ